VNRAARLIGVDVDVVLAKASGVVAPKCARNLTAVIT
jgi:hypothetical protein